MFFSLAHAQDAATQVAQAGEGLGPGTHQFIMIALIIGIFYFWLIRPQQKQQKELKKMIGDARKGDEVVMTSGIYGKISEVKDDVVMLQVANNVVLKFDRGSIQRIKGYDPKKAA